MKDEANLAYQLEAVPMSICNEQACWLPLVMLVCSSHHISQSDSLFEQKNVGEWTVISLDFFQVDYAEGLKASATQQLHSGIRSKVATGMIAGKHEEALKAGIRKRSLKESASEDLLQINHPCLQAGFAKPYRRIVYERVANPARVLLVGK